MKERKSDSVSPDQDQQTYRQLISNKKSDLIYQKQTSQNIGKTGVYIHDLTTNMKDFLENPTINSLKTLYDYLVGEKCDVGSRSNSPYLFHDLFGVNKYYGKLNEDQGVRIYFLNENTIIIEINEFLDNLKDTYEFLKKHDLNHITRIIINLTVVSSNSPRYRTQTHKKLFGKNLPTQRRTQSKTRTILRTAIRTTSSKIIPISHPDHQILTDIHINRKKNKITIQFIDSMNNLTVSHLNQHREIMGTQLAHVLSLLFPQIQNITRLDTFFMFHQTMDQKSCLSMSLFYLLALCKGYSLEEIKKLLPENRLIQQISGGLKRIPFTGYVTKTLSFLKTDYYKNNIELKELLKQKREQEKTVKKSPRTKTQQEKIIQLMSRGIQGPDAFKQIQQQLKRVLVGSPNDSRAREGGGRPSISQTDWQLI